MMMLRLAPLLLCELLLGNVPFLLISFSWAISSEHD
jgi:hypothetical protein